VHLVAQTELDQQVKITEYNIMLSLLILLESVSMWGYYRSSADVSICTAQQALVVKIILRFVDRVTFSCD
jgi:hypothetical protein